jgi:hypothetical protein
VVWTALGQQPGLKVNNPGLRAIDPGLRVNNPA